jgi:hypothetical protein
MAGASSDRLITCVADVATQDNGAPGGIRTPDHLIRSPMPADVPLGR